MWVTRAPLPFCALLQKKNKPLIGDQISALDIHATISNFMLQNWPEVSPQKKAECHQARTEIPSILMHWFYNDQLHSGIN